MKRERYRSAMALCPICKTKELLVKHHIRGKAVLNSEHPSNLIYVCPNCHQKIHHGIIILEGLFLTTSGMELFWHYHKDESFTGENIKPYISKLLNI